jgi:cell wall-associated NlpC family hydrolase
MFTTQRKVLLCQKQLILGVVLTLTLVLPLNPAQASPPEIISHWLDNPPASGRMACSLEAKFKEKYFKDSNFRLEHFSPAKPVAPLSGSLSPFNQAWPSSVRLASPVAAGSLADRLLVDARTHLNAPYRRGASLQHGRATDCSGFVQYIYRNFNIDLPRSSAEQSQVGKLAARQMNFAQLKPGDLLFFKRSGRRIDHVGIYMGEGKMVHASDHRRGVTITDLRQSRIARTFVMAKRVLEASSQR